jgi:hypothetical protein
MSEFHPDTLKGIPNNGMVAIHQIPGVDPLFAGLQCDSDPVFIRTANQQDILAFGPQIAMINIRRQVTSSQMTNVNRPVGIGQGGG